MARKNFRVFLGSNVILSGLLSDKGEPRIILDVLSLRLPFPFSGRNGVMKMVDCNVVFGIFPKDTTFQRQVINLGLETEAIFRGNFPFDYP